MLGSAMLFKYVPPDRLDIIEHGRLRFSQAGDFNDPFELRPIMQLLSAREIQSLPIDKEAGDGPNRILTAEVLGAMIRAVEPGLKGIAASHFSVGGAFVIDNNHLAQATFDEAVGVLCLSESPDNLPMWAHYGANHSGLVLGFDERHPFFAPIPFQGVSLGLAQVSYLEERPSVTAQTMWTEEVLTRKSLHWAYEREWRLLRPLSQANATLPHPRFPRALFDLPADALRLVITGVNTSPEMTERLVGAVRGDAKWSHVTIHHSQLKARAFGLDFSPPLSGAPPSAQFHACQAF